MYGKIIAGYDGRPSSEDALALAKVIAGATGAELTAAAIMLADPFWGGPDPHLRGLESDLREELAGAAERAGAELVIRPSTSTARGLHELAEELDADLLVVGSASAGRVGQLLAGNVALSLLHGSPCAVALAPKGYAESSAREVKEVTVGYDGSPESHAAIGDAIEFARRTGAALTIVGVAEVPPISYGKGANQGRRELAHDIEEIIHARLDELVGELPDGLRVKRVLASGDPAQVLVETAKADGGVLFVGSRAYGPLRSVLLGSVSRELVRSAPCTLIVHPRSAAVEPPAGALSGQRESAR
ncbi:MAG: universal stress protein [Thermoleophilaceae bacterium]|nr:universal stress protein [Thermoleophilaceae bacterium]